MWRFQSNVSIFSFLIVGLLHPPFCKMNIDINSINTLTDKHTSTHSMTKFKNLVENTVWFVFLNDFFHWYLMESVVTRQFIIFAFKTDVFSVVALLWISKPSDFWDTKVSSHDSTMYACVFSRNRCERNSLRGLPFPPQITRVKILNLLKLTHFKSTNRIQYVPTKIFNSRN